MQFPYILPSLVFASLIPAFVSVNACDVSGQAEGVSWSEDYHQALDAAKEERKFALIWFYDTRAASTTERFEREVWSQPEIVRALAEYYVAVRLPTDAEVTIGESQVTLLAHPAFAEMQRSPGIAVLDMTDESSPLFRQVVSVYPFRCLGQLHRQMGWE